MTEERIGGINVGIGGSLTELEAVLTKAERMVKESAERMGTVADSYFSPSGRAGQGGGRGNAGGGAVGNEQLVTAINHLSQQLSSTQVRGGARPPREQPEPVAYGRAGFGGPQAREYQILNQRLASASGTPSRVDQVHVTSDRPVDLNVDLSAFTKTVGEATEGLTALVAALADASRTAPAAASAGGGGSSRRARRVAEDEVYTFMPSDLSAAERRPQRARSTGRRERVPSIQPTASEQALLDALFPPEGEQAGLGRQRMQIVGEPKAAMNAPAAVEPIGLSRQRSAAMLAASRPETAVFRLRRRRVEAAASLTAMNAAYPPEVENATGGLSATIAQGRTRTIDEERAAEAARAHGRGYGAMASDAERMDRERILRQPITGRPSRILGGNEGTIFSDPATMRRLVGPQGAYQLRAAQIARDEEAAVIRREADVLTQGRTARTGASSLIGYAFGGRRGEAEAQARYQISDRAVKNAEAYKKRLDDIINAGRIEIETSKGGSRAMADEWVAAQRGASDYRDAEKQVADAVEVRGKALRDVERFTKGALPAVRNLFAITAGGAAFGLGLEAVDFGSKAAATSLGNLWDITSGFSVTSSKMTTALGQQTLALQGNAKAAVLTAEATSGISEAAAAAINPQLTLVTQIKAGAQAMSQASDLFRASYGIGNAPTGLYGGYGGLLGTSLFGQQLGGGMGYTERIAQDVKAMRGTGGTDILGSIGTGLAYANPFDASYRNAVNAAEKQSGGGFLSGAPDVLGGIGDMLSSLNPLGQNFLQKRVSSSGVPYGQQSPEAPAAPQLTAYMNDLNKAMERGAQVLGQSKGAHWAYTADLEKQQQAAIAAAAAGDQYGAAMAAQGVVLEDNTNKVVTNTEAYRRSTQQGSVGQATPDLGTVRQQAQAVSVYQEQLRQAQAAGSVQSIAMRQQYELPAFRNQLTRTANYAVGTQLPFGAYLANLAAPPPRIGSTLAAAGPGAGGAAEQRQIDATIRAAGALKAQMDSFYATGKQQMAEVYDPGVLQLFGQQGKQTFDGLIGLIGDVGGKMAQIQTSMNMEQAQYAAAQYTNDIRIASRSLTDIKQLTGQIGAATGDNLGLYERENLLLGRQAQQLQFMLSQRQINLQTAVAGFTVPGLTPAEQNARVQEAKVEASYAQKQLDIQRKMFGNQVKIVDIGNLRQATDLIHQIGLLQQGRRITLDIANKQELLAWYQKVQSQAVAQVNTYVGAVDSLQGKYISNIAEQEAAAGKAVATLASKSASAAYQVWHAIYLGITGGTMGGGGTAGYSTVKPVSGSNSKPTKLAGGGLFSTSGATPLTVGEAGTETVAVLRNPRSVSSGALGGGGGDIVINLTATLDGQVVYQNVIRRMGRDAALRGLRSPN